MDEHEKFDEKYNVFGKPEYINTLRAEFLREHSDMPARLNSALRRRSLKAAYLMVHTLYGNASIINEKKLVQLTKEVIPALKKKEMPDSENVEMLLIELERVINDLQLTVQDLPGKQEHMSKEEIKTLTSLLENALANSSPESFDMISDLRRLPSTSELISLIEGCDFAAALVVLKKLKSEGVFMGSRDAKPCILIIDDSPMELRALSMILQDEYELKIAKVGKTGIELAQQYKIDLIIVDLNMPGMSGFEVLYTLKDIEETSKIPVIIVTSSESSDDEVRGLALGAADFIRKPFVDAVVNLRVNMHIQMRKYIQTIEKLSTIDGLTGISNRRGFDQIIQTEWSRAMRKSEPLGMLVLDIDFFKIFNDTYGHLNGDHCLKVIAQIMVESVVRGNDFVFRWGGEEFVALLPDTSLDGVLAVAERLRLRIAETIIDCDHETTTVTASIGAGAIIPTVPGSGYTSKTDADNFFSDLDKALYRAKAEGRNRVVSTEFLQAEALQTENM